MAHEFTVTVICPKCRTRQDTILSYTPDRTPPTFPQPCTICGATFDQSDPSTGPLCLDCTQNQGGNLHFQPPDRKAPGETAAYAFLCQTCHRKRHTGINDSRPGRHFRPIRGTSGYPLA